MDQEGFRKENIAGRNLSTDFLHGKLHEID